MEPRRCGGLFISFEGRTFLLSRLRVSLLLVFQNDSSTGLKVTPEDLFNTFQRLTDENMKVRIIAS